MTESVDLFAHTAPEDGLLQRLEQLGCVVELDASLPLKDRLRHAITTQGIGMLILGRAPGGRPETLAEAWERIYREPFNMKQPSNRRSHNDRS